jgi:hypothetical protein
VHDALQSAARQAGLINDAEDLSGIRVGLRDDIFQGSLCQERVPVEHGAVPEMKEGPSEPACRSRLQTAVCCFGSKDRGRAMISYVCRMKKWCISGHNVTESQRPCRDSVSSTHPSRTTGLAGLETRNE